MANKYRPLDPKEIEFIEDNYNKMSQKEMAKVLDRSYGFVVKHVKTIDAWKSIQWTDDEDKYLKENYLDMTYVKIGERLGKSKSAIEGRCRKLGLSKSDRSKPWTKEQYQLLVDNINKLDYAELSKLIGRSPESIRKKAKTNKLRNPKLKNHKKLLEEEQLFIANNSMNMTDRELADKYDVQEKAISAVRKKHGIHKKGNEVRGETYIERKVKEYLDEQNIQYVFNEPLGDYRPDFLIKDTKLLIEVQGDYWHCNPYLYPYGPKDDIQIKHVLKDYSKKCYMLSRGYKILYLWEHDINKNWCDVKQKIDNFCRHNSTSTGEL